MRWLGSIIVSLVLFLATAQATNYHVDRGGSDANTGLSFAQAWKTIPKACMVARGGDTVFIYPGTYPSTEYYDGPCYWDPEETCNTFPMFPEEWGAGNPFYRTLLIPMGPSGGSGHVVFKGTGGARPLIRGDHVGLSSPYAGTHNVVTANLSYSQYPVHLDSLHLDMSTMAIVAVNSKFTGGGGHKITNCLLENLYENDPGIGLDNSGGIMNYDDATESGHNLYVANNEIRNIGVDQFGQGNENNCCGINLFNGDNAVIVNNYIHHVSAGGIKFKGHPGSGPENVRVDSNLIHDVMFGIDIGNAGTDIDSALVRWNVIYDFYESSSTLGGDNGFGIGQNRFSVNGVANHNVWIYNNTIHLTGTGSSEAWGIFMGNQEGNETYVFNNLILDQQTGVWKAIASHIAQVALYEDYNYLVRLSNPTTWDFYYYTPNAYTLSEWQSNAIGVVTGDGAHSIVTSTNPFIDSDGNDYRLTEGSAAETAGRGGDFPAYVGAYAPTEAEECADTLVAPVFESPANAATGQTIPVILDWSDSTQAGTVDLYDLQVDNNSDFGSVTFSSTTAWSRDTVTTTLDYSTTYYWRIRGRSDCDTSAWSGYRSFTTIDTCIVITELPYTMTASDTCYCLQDRLMSSAANGINTGGYDRVRIRNRYSTRDTLKFGTDGGDNYEGIYASSTDNITIDGLYIWHAPSAPIDSASDNICVYFTDCDTMNVWRTHIRPSGRDGRGIQNNSGGFNIDLWRVRHDSSGVRSFNSRCNHDANIFLLIPEPDHDDGDYFVNVHACSVYNAPHNILGTTGGPTYLPLIYVDSNYFSVDARNDMYTVGNSDTNSCLSSGDAAGIDILGAGAGSRISYNTIRSGSLNEGGVGMLLQNLVGQLGDSVLVFGNDVDVSSGPSSRFRVGRAFGLYLRYVPGTANTGSQYVDIRNNSWETTVDTDTNTTHIGRESETWTLILSGCGTGSNVSDSFKHIDFTANRVTSTRSGTISGWWETSAIGYGSCDSALAAYANNGHIKFSGNRYIAPRSVVEIGNMQGIPGSNWLSIGDTIDAISASDSTITFDRSGSYTDHSTNNRIRDAVYANNANDSAVSFDLGGATYNDTLGLSIRFERTLTALVVDAEAAPVSDADVWVWNDYGDTVLTGSTNGSGVFSGTALYKFLAEDKFVDTYTLTDSTGFNPFTIKAKKNTDSAQVEFTITATAATDTLQFSAAIPVAAVYLKGISIKGVTIK